MDKKQELEGLKKSSKPALSHVELVELARTCSPSQAIELARSAGWPDRQAKATRSLAILRRDYGDEVFKTFLVTMERVRSGEPDTEQAQDNRRNEMTDRVRKNLDRVTNPVARLRLAVKHGIKDQAAESISMLVESHRVVFWTDHEEKDILFDTLGDVPLPGVVSFDSEDQVGRMKQHKERILVAFIPSSGERAELMVDFGGMCVFLGWDSQEVKNFVCQVFEKLVATEPKQAGWRLFRATSQVCRTYLEGDEFIAEQTEIWLLRSQFRTGRVFELCRDALLVSVDRAKNEKDELNPIVDRFVQLGWAMGEVRDEFLGWVRSSVDNCRPQFMIAVAGAKCFDYQDAELSQLLVGRYRPGFWSNLILGRGKNQIEWYAALASVAMRDLDRDNEALFYREEFVKLLASGQFARTWQLILGLGHPLFFWGEMESSLEKYAEAYLRSLIPAAFDLAYENGDFGIAAALFNQFGLDACYDEKSIKTQVDLDFHARFVVLDQEYESIRDGDLENKEWKKKNEDLNRELDKSVEEIESRKREQIKGVIQLALDIEQPICFKDPLVYYLAPNWPKQ